MAETRDDSAILVVAAAVIRRGRVLTVQRGPHMRQSGLWELPGGKVEPGESEAAALTRELQEELRLTVLPTERLAENVHQYPHQTIRLIAWTCDLERGVPVLREHSALRWLDERQLRTVRWAPADLPLLPRVIEQLRLSIK